MNWLKRIVCRFCEWAGCCRDRQARIARLEQRVLSRPERARRDTSAESDALKAKTKELLDEGLSQSEVARQLGVSRQYISKIVRMGL